MESLLCIEGLEKTYETRKNSVTALQGFSLDVAEHEIVTIVGTSGCGKTSLLRIISGLTDPTKGTVRLDHSEPRDFRSRHGIGFVFQRFVLFPWRTILQNLLLSHEITHRATAEEASQRSHEFLELLGLSEFADFYPQQLSGGMLQRAALARALMLEPKLLLLDEPFGALDAMTREQLWTDFSRIWYERKTTVIMVTHSIREAVFLGHRTLVMTPRPGRIAGEFEVPFPQPRDHTITTHSQFIDLCETLRNKLGV